MRRIAAAMLLIVALALAGCHSLVDSPPETLEVYATFYPIYALTEALTLLPAAGVPDDVYQRAAAAFSEAELAGVMATAITINAWNRIGVGTRLSPAKR